METKKEFEAFENAMIGALKAGVISINSTFINECGKSKFLIDIDYPCPNLLFEIYKKAKTNEDKTLN